MRTTPQTLRDEIVKNFGENLTAEQLWVIVKLSKYVRLRARNNTAFNNLFNQVFPKALFRQVSKTRVDGSTYPGLSIVVNNIEHTGEESDES